MYRYRVGNDLAFITERVYTTIVGSGIHPTTGRYIPIDCRSFRPFGGHPTFPLAHKRFSPKTLWPSYLWPPTTRSTSTSAPFCAMTQSPHQTLEFSFQPHLVSVENRYSRPICKLVNIKHCRVWSPRSQVCQIMCPHLSHWLVSKHIQLQSSSQCLKTNYLCPWSGWSMNINLILCLQSALNTLDIRFLSKIMLSPKEIQNLQRLY